MLHYIQLLNHYEKPSNVVCYVYNECIYSIIAYTPFVLILKHMVQYIHDYFLNLLRNNHDSSRGSGVIMASCPINEKPYFLFKLNSNYVTGDISFDAIFNSCL